MDILSCAHWQLKKCLPAIMAANLKDTILFVLNRFEISSQQIYSCTTDNGRNMVKFVELLSNENIPEELYDDSSYENETDVDNDLSFMNDVVLENKCISVRCAAHTLQLAVNAVLKDKNCSKTIGFARNLVKKLRTPTMSYIMKEKNLRKPPIDCPTRWSSSDKMLAYFVEDAVYHLYLDQKVWDSIREIVSLLEPAEVVTSKLQSQNLVFGDFYHTWISCKLLVQKNNSKLAKFLLKELEDREILLFENDAFLCGIFLDPRFNITLSKNQKQTCISLLSNIYFQILSISNNSISIIEKSLEASLSESFDEVDKYLKLEEARSVGSPSCMSTCSLLESIQIFLKQRRLSKSTDIIKWWSESSEKFPELFTISQVALCVPATQVSVGRLFSSVKFIMNPLRNRLDMKTLNAIMLLRTNHMFSK
nr:E3 SUMO-protein ligase ZBED1-like [Drosophila suzukii]XP_036678275.1 E3 SUMO-protein ligase ZBED1-like [Drosophila suzukii]